MRKLSAQRRLCFNLNQKDSRRAGAGFNQWRCGVNSHAEEGFPCSDVGFPKGNCPEEFLANMLALLEDAAAKVGNPPFLARILT